MVAFEKGQTMVEREQLVTMTLRAFETPFAPLTSIIYQEPWWLDAVAPGQWGEAVVHCGGDIAAKMVYITKHKWGIRAVTHPPLTPYVGPWLRDEFGNLETGYAEQKRILSELITLLPPFDVCRASFLPGMFAAIPFYWAGFDLKVRYTYRISNLCCLEDIWRNFSSDTRKHIRKAEQSLEIREDLGIEQLLRLNKLVFERQGLRQPYSDEVVKRLDAACSSRGRRRMTFAVDRAGNVHSSYYVIWDKNAAYGVIGGSDPAFRSSGAAAMLIWDHIKFASTVTPVFDFCGSMKPSVERFFRGFGGMQVPYIHVVATNRKYRTLSAIREAMTFSSEGERGVPIPSIR
jgi:hypothetical protein